MSVYVGIDVHRKRSQVAVVDQAGEVLANRNVVNRAEPMLRLIGDLPVGTPVAFEAAFGWGWLVELLEDYGFDPHLVHPTRCKAIASARLTNDKVDAHILARLLRADLLPEAWIAPPATRQLRAVLRHRIGLVRLRTLLRNRVHAVLADHGHDRAAGCWSGPGRQWLAGLGLPAGSRAVIEDCLAMIDAVQAPIDRLDVEVHQRAKADPRVTVLTQLPGVGSLTALVILAEIGDITRFGSARKLAAWAGLTPTVRGSDRTVRHGHICKQGSTWLRWIRCQAAQTAKRSPQLAATYQAITRRRGKKTATTAIARKLLTRAYHLLTATDTPAGAALTTPAHPGPTAPLHRPGGSPPPGELAFSHEPAQPRSIDPTEQPGPRMPRSWTPATAGLRMGACQTSPPTTPGDTTATHTTSHQARLPRCPMIRRPSSESSSFVLGSATNGSACGRSSWTPPTRRRRKQLQGNQQRTQSASPPRGQTGHRVRISCALDTPGPYGCDNALAVTVSLPISRRCIALTCSDGALGGKGQVSDPWSTHGRSR